MIPYGRQNINQKDIDSVIDVLQSDWLTQGDKVPEFESTIANYCNVKHVVAVNSATSALHIACLSLELQKGDIVWTTPISFVASANCALYCGASIDFVDIDKDNFNLCTIALEKKLRIAQSNNSLPKILIVVHLAGLSCDMKVISSLAQKFGISIIEDASHAIGSTYQNYPVGSCKYSDISIFSFHPVKIITTAEGGAATTNSEKLANKMANYRSHGITKPKASLELNGQWYYEQLSLGFNYRMTDIHAALGVSQFSRLNDFVKKRNTIAQKYKLALKNLPLVWQHQSPNALNSYHLFLIRLTKSSRCSRKFLFDNLRAAGIGVNVHYIPIHTQPYFRELGFKIGDFPVAEEYYNNCLSLPLYPDLTIQDFDYIVKTLKELLLK